MEDTKRLGLPVLIIFLSAFLVKVLNTFWASSITITISTILIVISLFTFGMVLNKSRKKRSPAVFKKVVAILVIILLTLMQLGYFSIPYVTKTFDFFGIDAFFINMIYIFCGYMFAD